MAKRLYTTPSAKSPPRSADSRARCKHSGRPSEIPILRGAITLPEALPDKGPISNQGAPADTPKGVDPPRSNAVTTLITSVPIVAGVAYSIVRLAYDEYYKSLGVKAAEVGFDQVAAAGQLLVAVLTYIGFGLAISWLIFIPATAVSDHFSRRRRTASETGPTPPALSVGQRAFFLAAIGIWPVVIVFQLQAPSSFDIGRPGTLQIGGLAAWLSGTFIPWVLAIAVPAAIAVLARKGKAASQTWVGLCLLSVGLGVTIILAAAHQAGQWAALRLQLLGGAAEGEPLVSWLSFPAPCVSPEWLPQSSESPVDLPKSNVAYLGSAGQTLVLYDLAEGQPLRLPVQRVLLHGSARDECTGLIGEAERFLEELEDGASE